MAYIGEEKLDGHRSTMCITEQGNRFFSRRISKKTGWYSENTDCIPHLRDYVGFSDYMGTILDGEITMPSGIFADVQGVLGALPETALQKQLEAGFAVFNAFDILYYKGVNIQKFPLWKRKLYLAKVLRENYNSCFKEVPFYATARTIERWIKLKDSHEEGKWYFDPIPTCISSFKQLCQDEWKKGHEGLILKNIDAPYSQKRSKDFLKIKKCKKYDVVIMGYGEPTVWYDGKTLDEKGTWDYWADAEDEMDCVIQTMTREEAENDGLLPVTKPHAMDWIGALIVGVWKGKKLVKVAEAKGITDADQEYIKANKKKLIGTAVEIEAQEIIDIKTGSLRHPRFSRWREDKNGEDCTWKDFIEVG